MEQQTFGYLSWQMYRVQVQLLQAVIKTADNM